MHAIKVILDTDIGSDIDDAVCLAYLLAQPRCDLLGVTTVSGRSTERAMMASALAKVAGKPLPIYPGASEPLVSPQRQPLAPQAARLVNWPHDTKFPEGEAVDFLRRTIRKHPGEVTLLTIGPLTNAALLFSVDPSCASMLKSLVIMGGAFLGDWPYAEWNCRCDPHATEIVYRARPPLHRSIGLDVTTKVQLSKAEVRRRFTKKLLRPVLDFAEVWFRRAERLTFHDPLAAATIFDPRICAFERGLVSVNTATPVLNDQGRTTWCPGDASSPHEVAISVNPARFFSHYFGVFK